MKSPFTGKEMSIEIRNEDLTFRKETFNVAYPSYFCSDSKEFFTTTEFDTIKMRQVYNQYRDKYNLPFPEEIKEIRAKYGLSATKMSEILGFGVNSYRNYENGEVPNQSNANLIQLANNPIQFKSLVELSNVFKIDSDDKNDFTEEGYKLLNKIDRLIEEKKRIRFSLRLENYLLGNKLPDNYSGYIKPNIEKLTEMVVFFAETMQPYVTQLNKLLFYCDFLHYKKEAVSISGTRYRAINMGPVPNNYDSIFDYIESTGAVKIIKTEFDRGYSQEFISKKEFDSEKFTNKELECLNKVYQEFKTKNTTEIIEKSHLEDAWKDNFENGKSLIDYKYAFNLNI
ncbi:type II TA system antitoxin MqsA family protein [Aquimarina algiphila]|uniref:type II TA system antitoxin MqsA family protein n=1 Tax=Aquimarina algiphila TaxID=2047982 RepID=UPI00232D0DB0|nr:type II TA system antitoxin MqsA family protein [Aquimarina algiphila]